VFISSFSIYTLYPLPFREADGAIIVYTITDSSSLRNLRKFYMKCCRIKDSDSVPLVVVGNKCDLEDQREVMTSEGKELGKELLSEKLTLLG
jgi:GTPase SAR1 family protein